MANAKFVVSAHCLLKDFFLEIYFTKQLVCPFFTENRLFSNVSMVPFFYFKTFLFVNNFMRRTDAHAIFF